MKITLLLSQAAFCAAAVTAAFGAGDPAGAVELAPAPEAAWRAHVGVSYRGGMKLEAKGAGSRAAGAAASSSSAKGTPASGQDSESASLSFGYNGGDRTFGSGTTALGSGSVKADGTYTGGDYSPVYDDVYFSDNRTTTETVGGRTTTKTSSAATGAMSWKEDDGLDGWGFAADAEMPLCDMGDGLELSLFAGFGGWWGVEGRSKGTGAGVATKTTTTTTGAATKTTESFYDLTAPLRLDGRLDFDNAEVFQGSVVKYTPQADRSSSRTTTAFSVAEIEAEADIWQVPLGVALRCKAGRFSFAIRPALLLSYIDAEVTRREVLATASGKTLGAWRDKGGEGKFALGAGADLCVECALWGGWGLWLSGGYEWVDSVDFAVGPQKVELDPSAWTVSAGVAAAF